ncbi:MAG TPA: hypothetical protein VNL70_06170, partial [Tepidisphaeraceae bacterium]|nr:hypothetical protein [Tepidisphaeraceae bacterium]
SFSRWRRMAVSRTIPLLTMNRRRPESLGIPRTAWVAMLLGICTAALGYQAAGVSLGLPLAGFVFAAIIVPPMCAAENRLLDRLLVAAGANDGIALVVLLAVLHPAITFVQWLQWYALMIAWCAALAGTLSLIRRFIPASAAAGIVVLLALAWLSWPIWTAAHLRGAAAAEIVAAVVHPHPLFATNRVMLNLGLWTQQPLAYGTLLSLGQDVPYELPANILPAALGHLLLGVTGLWLSGGGRR